MIERVTFERTTYAGLPNRFEAGTPNIAGAAGLAAAIDFVDSIGFEAIAAQEADLLACASERIGGIAGVKLVGTARRKASVLSFVVEGMSSLDVGVKLDLEGIAVRTGHHCCQPVMDRFGIPGTVRASLAMYNTRDEVEALAAALERITAASRARHDSGADGKSHEASVEYPAAFGPSPWAVADELAEEFAFLGDRTARSEYVLDLGKQLPDLFAMLKRVTEPVPGCMSEVYVVGRRSPKDPAVLEFVADANAEIVRGLIAVLQRLYSGQRARDVLAFDIESFFRRIQLDQFLSSQRRNGLQGMVTRIRALAASVDGGEHGGRP